jgi:hypothetical protein
LGPRSTSVDVVSPGGQTISVSVPAGQSGDRSRIIGP